MQYEYLIFFFFDKIDIHLNGERDFVDPNNKTVLALINCSSRNYFIPKLNFITKKGYFSSDYTMVGVNKR